MTEDEKAAFDKKVRKSAMLQTVLAFVAIFVVRDLPRVLFRRRR